MFETETKTKASDQFAYANNSWDEKKKVFFFGWSRQLGLKIYCMITLVALKPSISQKNE